MGPVSRIDRKRMRGNFSAHAEDYDRHAAVQKRVIARLSSLLRDEPIPAGMTLDIGTGTGGLAHALSLMDEGQGLVLMDIAHDMSCRAAGRLPCAMVCDGDARLLPFHDQSFARVVSSSVYQWVDDLAGAFAEVVRVLRPGGLFAVALFGERTLAELRDSHRRAVATCDPSALSHVQSFPSVAEVAAALESSGFGTVRTETAMEVEYHPDVADLLRQLKKIGASNAAADRPRGLAPRRVMQEMVRCYERYYRCGEGLPASYEVIVALASKP